MCGIVGLFMKGQKRQDELGHLLAGMLDVMSDRGPDSAGFAVYGDTDRVETGDVKLTLRAIVPGAMDEALGALAGALGRTLSPVVNDTHAVVTISDGEEAKVRALLDSLPDVDLVGAGRHMELYKEVGLPGAVAARFGLATMTGTHAIGHTRMATESAVTTTGAHPFSTGRDQCLVHNGSLSNHASLRRMLISEGLSFATENDSEVAAGYLSWKMREGASLKQALEAGLADLDGFYTFVVGTAKGFAVLRDPIACKPAVMAETEDYVAFGSEYRALAGLPGIESARVFEPEPATVYVWERR